MKKTYAIYRVDKNVSPTVLIREEGGYETEKVAETVLKEYGNPPDAYSIFPEYTKA